jgi:cellulose biosynthesis protein BcsQ
MKLNKKLLTDVTILLVDNVLSTSLLELPRIDKYQQGHLIVERIISYYTSLCGKEQVGVNNNSTTEIICVYSPIGGSGKTTISFALANMLSMQGYRTLFLSLEEFPSYTKLLDNIYNSSLSDLLYHIKKRSPNLIMKLEGIKKNDNITGMSYIPPPICKEDMTSLEDEDWMQLMNCLLKAKEYKYIIIDFTSECSARNSLMMEKCHKKIILTNYTIGSNERLKALFENGNSSGEKLENVIIVANATKPSMDATIQEFGESRIVCEIPFIENLYSRNNEKININLDNSFGQEIKKLGKVINMDG